MKISLIGPCGSGKSTLAQLFSQRYTVPVVSAGHLIRHKDAYPWINDIIGDYDVHSGELLSDDKLILIMQKALSHCPLGWVLDGIPRQIAQCQAMMDLFKPSLIIILRSSLSLIMDRLSHRWYHPASGRIYHTIFKPPKISGYDDLTGDPLIRRDDDAPDVITKRYHIYQSTTRAMIEYLYGLNTDVPIIDVDVTAQQTPEQIVNDIITHYEAMLD